MCIICIIYTMKCKNNLIEECNLTKLIFIFEKVFIFFNIFFSQLYKSLIKISNKKINFKNYYFYS